MITYLLTYQILLAEYRHGTGWMDYKIHFNMVTHSSCLYPLIVLDILGVTFSLRAFLGSYFASPLQAFPGEVRCLYI